MGNSIWRLGRKSKGVAQGFESLANTKAPSLKLHHLRKDTPRKKSPNPRTISKSGSGNPMPKHLQKGGIKTEASNVRATIANPKN